MMDTLLALSNRDLEEELKKPNRLRLYPKPGNSDPNGIEILWAPFDFINRDARIVIVGVTPGPNQALLSYNAVRTAAAQGKNPREDLERIKVEASFRGPVMEPNLKSILEHSGLAELAGIEDIDDLWTRESRRVHFTSTIRYPAFINGKLFNNQIDSLGHSELRRYVETFLAEELASVTAEAVIVALGQEGPKIVRHAAKAAGLDPERVVALPHPSPSANGSVRDFLSKERTRSVRPCRCMLCDRNRIPKRWDLSKRFHTHDLTHGKGRSADAK